MGGGTRVAQVLSMTVALPVVKKQLERELSRAGRGSERGVGAARGRPCLRSCSCLRTKPHTHTHTNCVQTVTQTFIKHTPLLAFCSQSVDAFSIKESRWFVHMDKKTAEGAGVAKRWRGGKKWLRLVTVLPSTPRLELGISRSGGGRLIH